METDTVHVICLGTGTSHGVPMIGCDCAVCTSDDPRNQRTRSSIFIRTGGVNLLFDTATEMRMQVLRHGIRRLDAIFYTHDHADHVQGIDDLRTFTQMQRKPLPVYGPADALEMIRARCPYIFGDPDFRLGFSIPRLELHPLAAGETAQVEDTRVEAIEILHGERPIHAYRIGRFAYLTDCSGVPDRALEQLQGVDTLIIDGLRPKPHRTHFSIGQAIEAAERIGARRTFLTHLTHDVDHAQIEAGLPPHVRLAYDGLELDVPG
ncbi:MAG: MBL fold metallo-hydrolase [Lentisphaeria bacterium]|nr:MBL fold metallo-hydrolase [Lentisphaeria bacterium]